MGSDGGCAAVSTSDVAPLNAKSAHPGLEPTIDKARHYLKGLNIAAFSTLKDFWI